MWSCPQLDFSHASIKKEKRSIFIGHFAFSDILVSLHNQWARVVASVHAKKKKTVKEYVNLLRAPYIHKHTFWSFIVNSVYSHHWMYYQTFNICILLQFLLNWSCSHLPKKPSLPLLPRWTLSTSNFSKSLSKSGVGGFKYICVLTHPGQPLWIKLY